MFPLIPHIHRFRSVAAMDQGPLAVHGLDTGGVGEDPPNSAELPSRPHCRSSEGETHACKCSPSQSVAFRCTHPHMSSCKSRTPVRVSSCKSHTTVRVYIYVCMYIYIHNIRIIRCIGRQRRHRGTAATVGTSSGATGTSSGSPCMHMTSPSVRASVHTHIGSLAIV